MDPGYTFTLSCSFMPMLHPQYDMIESECEPWTQAMAAPPSASAADFLRRSLLPLAQSLNYPTCATDRAVLITKWLTWFFCSDDDDDNPAIRGATDRVQQRHDLILGCLAGKPLPPNLRALAGDALNTTRALDALHDIWKDISKDMPPKMQSRFAEATRHYLDAVRVQSQCRKAGCLPGVDEYVKVLRRNAVYAEGFIILIEYGLGIELDEETLGSELMVRLQAAVSDNVGLFNDLLSCENERSCGDYFNLPSVIANARPGLTFVDAVEEAASMVQEADKLAVQLIAEVENSRLMEKPGVDAYLRGLEYFMAGNVDWSIETMRYTHTCSPQGVVRSVPNSIRNHLLSSSSSLKRRASPSHFAALKKVIHHGSI